MISSSSLDYFWWRRFPLFWMHFCIHIVLKHIFSKSLHMLFYCKPHGSSLTTIFLAFVHESPPLLSLALAAIFHECPSRLHPGILPYSFLLQENQFPKGDWGCWWGIRICRLISCFHLWFPKCHDHFQSVMMIAEGKELSLSTGFNNPYWFHFQWPAEFHSKLLFQPVNWMIIWQTKYPILLFSVWHYLARNWFTSWWWHIICGDRSACWDNEDVHILWNGQFITVSLISNSI